MDAYDLADCAALPAWATQELNGLDAVIVTTGVAAFGPCQEVPDAVAEHLMTVNALAPMAVLRAALGQLTGGGALVAISGIVAAHPPAGMADYAASKSALSSWLTALRAEHRNDELQILDARLPHLDTGFATRAVHGSPPPLPSPVSGIEAAAAIVDALQDSAGMLRAHPRGGFATS
jgi:short-subunit dehydrogenase